MKTLKLRVWSLGLVLLTISLTTGCHEQRARADVPVFSVPITGEVTHPDLPPIPLALPEPGSDTNALPTLAADGSVTNAPANPPRMVQEPTLPQDIKVSAALAEIIQLVQAGVSEEVILSYVTNSADAFNATSDNIVYLNDLGVSTAVITAIIQHDASPEMQAKRSSAAALPPGVALTTPATNVYPATRGTQPIPSYAEPTATTETAELPAAVETAAPATESVTVNHFYSSLSPYGTWVDVDGYGLCWRPTVAVVNPHWRPYSHAGRWMWSDAGWYWYSDYSWGWAPFHYGRWCSYPRLGWIWVPDTVWAPSWVTWRYSPGYCGWAPLPPGCHYRSSGLYYYNRHVGISFDFGFSSSYYCYVPSSRFCDWNPSRHFLPLKNVTHIHKNTTIINNYGSRGRDIVNKGPDVGAIGKAVKSKIPQVRIRDEPLQAARKAKPERVETIGGAVGVVRPQLPQNAPGFVARPRTGGEIRVRPASVAGGQTSATRDGSKSVIGSSLGQPTAKPKHSPLQPRESRQTVTIKQPPARVSPPIVTGNNQPQNNSPRNGIGNNVRREEPRNLIARPGQSQTRNSGPPSAVARMNPSLGNISPVETPRANRAEPRSDGILVQPFRQSGGNSPANAPRASTPNRGNDVPIRSFANPTPAPRVERPTAAPVVPRASAPPITRPAPRAFTPAPAARSDAPRSHGGGFGGAVSAPSRSHAPAVSAPSAPRQSGGGGGNAVRNGGGGGGSGGGGKGGRGRD